YGGELKNDEIKALWEAGVDTPDIHEDLITDYLHGDISNTTKIFKGQLTKARERGQVKQLMVNFGSLAYTIEAELNGMYVDKELGLEIAAELAEELAGLDKEMADYLPKDLPFDFGWGNRYHLSPLIFGGKVKYQSRQYDLADGTTTFVAPTEEEKDRYVYAMMDSVQFVKADGTTTEDPLDPTIVFYQSGKNEGQAKTKKVKVPNYDKPKSRMADRFFEFEGFPEPDPSWARATEGLYSVAA